MSIRLNGVFYRINSRPFLKPNIPLPKTPHHEWLDHDSYLHIDPLVLDDYIVGEALKRCALSEPYRPFSVAT